MGHPEIDNRTPFAFEPLFAADEDLRPLIVTIVKATFVFDDNGEVRPADDQLRVNLAGEPATPAPVSSYRFEPEVAFGKVTTDVVLIGHAQPPGRGITELDVGIKVGPVQKRARVFGDRFWVMANHAVRMSRAAPLEPVALTWENAFGGQDSSLSTAERVVIEAQNPVGTGFGHPLKQDGERLKLPNIEDPTHLIDAYGANVPPCGFGFTSPDWQPRATLAGTYDDAWARTRKPMLPIDFDRRFFNAAAPGLIAPDFLRGDEEVVLLNVTKIPRLAFSLPALPPPECRVALRGLPDVVLQTNLDTVIVDADANQLILLWRAFAPAAGGPHDVVAIEVRPTN